jgi:hypothetical protein
MGFVGNIWAVEDIGAADSNSSGARQFSNRFITFLLRSNTVGMLPRPPTSSRRFIFTHGLIGAASYRLKRVH